MPKYKVFTNDKDLVRVGCMHNGKMIYEEALCHAEDDFNYEVGYKLAKARLDEKILRMKMQTAWDKIDCLHELKNSITDRILKLQDDEIDIHRKYLEAQKERQKLEREVLF